jgi:Family of unknown function (DUF6880)
MHECSPGQHETCPWLHEFPGGARFSPSLAGPSPRRSAGADPCCGDRRKSHYLLDPAAQLIEGKHPLATTLLRRAMMEDTLDGAKSSRYKLAARHLLECVSPASSIQDFGTFDTHETFSAVCTSSMAEKLTSGLRQRVVRKPTLILPQRSPSMATLHSFVVTGPDCLGSPALEGIPTSILYRIYTGRGNGDDPLREA